MSTKGVPILVDQLSTGGTLKSPLQFALRTFFFFSNFVFTQGDYLFYQCYPPGIASLIVGNTVIYYFQIG